jgi:hypothetical protein
MGKWLFSPARDDGQNAAIICKLLQDGNFQFLVFFPLDEDKTPKSTWEFGTRGL